MSDHPQPFGFDNHLIQGDPMEPCSTDIITQLAQLGVGGPVPDGWRVLTGNNDTSIIARTAYRFEIEEDAIFESEG